MNLYSELESRSLLKQVTDPALSSVLSRGPLTLYCGFDPTSDSLHVGSLLPLLTLRRFALAGHRAIAVVGGATGMIGDPSGKAKERTLLNAESLAKNLAGIRTQIEALCPGAVLVNNYDWFKDFGYLEFLRDVGKHFSVNAMMAKDSVRTRLEDRDQGISYTEFSYMLLQAYDFLALNRSHGCTLQIGGSDQWGNITAGTELIRRMFAAEEKQSPEVFGLTFPLVTKADGSKFGKSEGGNIWLDPARTSPYQFYQFFLNSSDADIVALTHYFSFRPLAQISAQITEFQQNPAGRLLQRELAREMTDLVHGVPARTQAESAAEALFSGKLSALPAEILKDVLADAPTTELPRARLAGPGLPLVDAVAESGLCPSKGQARKDIQAGGIYVNGERVADVAATLTESHLLGGSIISLRKGKKTNAVLRFV